MTPEQLRAKKCNLYATCDSIDDVLTTYNIVGENVIPVLIAVNTTLEMLAKEAEGQEVGDE